MRIKRRGIAGRRGLPHKVDRIRKRTGLLCTASTVVYAIRHYANLSRPTLALTFTTSRPTNRACLDRWDPLIWVFLPVELLDLCRLEEHHGTATAAVFAPAAPLPVLAEATAAAVLALGTPPPVLAEAAAAAVLAPAAPPPVLADAAAAAVLAAVAPPPVFALLVSHCPRLPSRCSSRSKLPVVPGRRAVLVREIMK